MFTAKDVDAAYYAKTLAGRPENYLPVVSGTTYRMLVSKYFTCTIPLCHLSDVFMTKDTSLYFNALGQT